MSQNHDINHDFIEKSWEDMSVILDREMPQKPKKRWLFFWLAIGVSVVTVFLLVNRSSENIDATDMVLHNEVKEKLNSTQLISSEPISTQSVHETQLVLDRDTSEEENKQEEIAIAQPQTAITITQANVDAFPITSNTNTLPQLEGTESIIVQEEAIVNYTIENASITTTPTVLNNHPFSTIALSSERASSLPSMPLPYLQVSSISTVERLEVPLDMNITPLQTVSKMSNWSSVFSLNGLYSPSENFRGYGVGADVSYHLAPSFGLSIGGGITKWDITGSIAETATVLDLEPGGASNDQFAKEIISLTPLSKWDGHASLSTFVKPFAPLSIYGGVRARVEFNISYQDENAFIEIPSDQEAISELIDNNDAIRKEEIKNPFINPFVGVSLAIRKGIELRGEMEFKRDIDQSFDTKPIYFIGSLAYRF